ncbi:DUF3558 domain-containing protein [Nocardia sp. AG03]|uniref:DUF3558 domain-containing protein n=1 Tax=Nocardia sp. AG03 TaxID=3025312 RepID=UPI0024182A0B|nr:DUF3558 domain-containing protein [Nocardia sp. AG03]
MGAAKTRGGGLIALIGAVLMVAACGPSEDESAPGNTSPTYAAEVPTGFDPCTQIPDEVIKSENLVSTGESTLGGPSRPYWRGCGWVYKNGDGYGTAIRTTNLTLEMIRARNFSDAEEFVLSGNRQAIVSRQGASDAAVPELDDSCTANIQMDGGSLDIAVTNPKQSSPATAHIPACTIARTLAEKIAPAIPAGA